MPLTLPRPLLLGCLVATLGASLVAGCGEGGTEPPPPPPPRVPASLAAASPISLSGTVAAPVPDPPRIRVADSSGAPLPGVTVTWQSTGGGVLSAASSATGADGIATVGWTLGTSAETLYTATARVTGLAQSVGFTATARPEPAAMLQALSGDGQAGIAGTELPVPLRLRAADRFGNGVSGVAVAWSAGPAGGQMTPSATTTDSAGHAESRRTLGLSLGTQIATASAAGLAGSPLGFSATALSGPATTISLAGGDQQTAAAGTVLPESLVVRIADDNGIGVPGLGVTWTVTSGGGSVSSALSVTGSDGRAGVRRTLGPAAGTQGTSASVSGVAGSPVSFTSTAIPGAAASMALLSGNGQTGTVGAALPELLRVRVADPAGNGVADVTVTWAAATGGGTVSSATSVTDAGGIASIGRTLGTAAGSQSTTAAVGGLTGSPVTFQHSAVAGAAARLALAGGDGQSAPAATALPAPLEVRVFDAFDNPVAGTTVAWAAGAGSVSAPSTTTDAAGRTSAQWTLGPVSGTQSATASVSGTTGSPITFTAAATPNATISGTVTIAAGSLAPPAPSAGFGAGATEVPAGSAGGDLIVTFDPAALGAPPVGARGHASAATARSVGDAIRARLAPALAVAGRRLSGVSPALLAARIAVDPRVADAEAGALRGLPGVVRVQRSARVGAVRAPVVASPPPVRPNDPLWARQAWHHAMVDLPEAWTLTTGSAAVLVAVIDDGIRFDHPAIAANLTNDGYDFVSNADSASLCAGGKIGRTGDGNGYDPDPTNPADYEINQSTGCLMGLKAAGNHGLHVAGVLGAAGNDGIGVTGVNWAVRIRPVRALGLDGGNDYDLAQAILYAAGLPADDGAGGTVQAPSGARVINMSLGTATPTAVLENAVISAANAGALLVAAAGNGASSMPVYPAAYPQTLSISAVGPDGLLASYSSFGPTVDLSAPGGDFADGDASFGVYSTMWNYTTGQPIYEASHGTSFAAPHVAGVAALLLAREPGLTASDLRSRLLTWAVDAGAPGPDQQYGAGILNARNSLTQSMAPARQRHVRLYDAAGAQVRSAAAAADGSYAFSALPEGSYRVYAGEDEDGDGQVGVPGRRWGALGGSAAPGTVEVIGAGSYPATFAVGYPAEQEPNGSTPSANALAMGGYQAGGSGGGDADVYRLLVPAAGSYVIETVAVDGACGFALEEDTILRLTDGGGATVATNDDADPAALDYCSRIGMSLTPGTYFVTVEGKRGGRYQVRARAN